MAEGELKLLGTWASTFTIRVRMVLEQKGLSYEYLEEDILNKGKLLLKQNTVLIHNDRSICESLLILQYIDEKWSGIGPPVLPADPYERYVARFWATYIDNKLLPSFVGVLNALTEETKTEKVADTLAALEQLEGAFKKCSAGKSFFGGDSIGFLDVTLGCELTWIRAVEKISKTKLLDETNVPLLIEWEKCFLAADFVKRLLPSVKRVEKLAIELRDTIWKVSFFN